MWTKCRWTSLQLLLYLPYMPSLLFWGVLRITFTDFKMMMISPWEKKSGTPNRGTHLYKSCMGTAYVTETPPPKIALEGIVALVLVPKTFGWCPALGTLGYFSRMPVGVKSYCNHCDPLSLDKILVFTDILEANKKIRLFSTSTNIQHILRSVFFCNKNMNILDLLKMNCYTLYHGIHHHQTTF